MPSFCYDALGRVDGWALRHPHGNSRQETPTATRARGWRSRQSAYLVSHRRTGGRRTCELKHKAFSTLQCLAPLESINRETLHETGTQRTMAPFTDRRNSRTRQQTSPQNFPTASGGIARLAYEQAKAAGLDAKRLLNRAKLTLQQVTDDRIRLAVKDQIEFLNLVAAALPAEFLGIRLAQKTDLREIGLLYYVLASSEKLTDALQRVARYSGLNNEGIRITYSQHNGSITFHPIGISRLSDRHQIEFFVTILL